ncbi:MAG: hypothetical protein WKF75_07040 [Singulisphaera sp.]
MQRRDLLRADRSGALCLTAASMPTARPGAGSRVDHRRTATPARARRWPPWTSFADPEVTLRRRGGGDRQDGHLPIENPTYEEANRRSPGWSRTPRQVHRLAGTTRRRGKIERLLTRK